jgi:hypothetical protein
MEARIRVVLFRRRFFRLAMHESGLKKAICSLGDRDGEKRKFSFE